LCALRQRVNDETEEQRFEPAILSPASKAAPAWTGPRAARGYQRGKFFELMCSASAHSVLLFSQLFR